MIRLVEIFYIVLIQGCVYKTFDWKIMREKPPVLPPVELIMSSQSIQEQNIRQALGNLYLLQNVWRKLFLTFERKWKSVLRNDALVVT